MCVNIHVECVCVCLSLRVSFTPEEPELKEVKQLFNGDLTIPHNFTPTSTPHTSTPSHYHSKPHPSPSLPSALSLSFSLSLSPSLSLSMTKVCVHERIHRQLSSVKLWVLATATLPVSKPLLIKTLRIDNPQLLSVKCYMYMYSFSFHSRIF